MQPIRYYVRVYNEVTGEVYEMHTYNPRQFDRIARLLKEAAKWEQPSLPDSALRVETGEY